jgi:hypothetical protein
MVLLDVSLLVSPPWHCLFTFFSFSSLMTSIREFLATMLALITRSDQTQAHTPWTPKQKPGDPIIVNVVVVVVVVLVSSVDLSYYYFATLTHHEKE